MLARRRPSELARGGDPRSSGAPSLSSSLPPSSAGEAPTAQIHDGGNARRRSWRGFTAAQEGGASPDPRWFPAQGGGGFSPSRFVDRGLDPEVEEVQIPGRLPLPLFNLPHSSLSPLCRSGHGGSRSGGVAPPGGGSRGGSTGSGGGSSGGGDDGAAALDGLDEPVDGLGGPVQGFFSFFCYFGMIYRGGHS